VPQHPYVQGRPLVPVILSRPGHQSIVLIALVDSGADGCLFDTGIAKAFGLKKGDRGVRRNSSQGISGGMRTWRWPRGRFSLDFFGTTFPIDPTFADLAVHGAAFNLLGRADFFAQFDTVNFDQKNLRVEIR